MLIVPQFASISYDCRICPKCRISSTPQRRIRSASERPYKQHQAASSYLPTIANLKFEFSRTVSSVVCAPQALWFETRCALCYEVRWHRVLWLWQPHVCAVLGGNMMLYSVPGPIPSLFSLRGRRPVCLPRCRLAGEAARLRQQRATSSSQVCRIWNHLWDGPGCPGAEALYCIERGKFSSALLHQQVSL